MLTFSYQAEYQRCLPSGTGGLPMTAVPYRFQPYQEPYRTVDTLVCWAYGTGCDRWHTVSHPSVYGRMPYTVQRAALQVLLSLTHRSILSYLLSLSYL